MKQFLSISKLPVFVLAATFFVTGCLSATHPLPHRDRLQEDSPFVGYWHGLIPQSSGEQKLQIWSVYYFGGGRLTAVMSDKKAHPREDFGEVRAGEDTGIYDVYTSKIGEDTYITLKPIKGTDGHDYMILRVVLEGDKLTAWNISDEAVKKGVESKQLRSQRGSNTITSKSSDMAKWIETLSPEDFEFYGAFERSAIGPKELTHRLLSLYPSQN